MFDWNKTDDIKNEKWNSKDYVLNNFDTISNIHLFDSGIFLEHPNDFLTAASKFYENNQATKQTIHNLCKIFQLYPQLLNNSDVFLFFLTNYYGEFFFCKIFEHINSQENFINVKFEQYFSNIKFVQKLIDNEQVQSSMFQYFSDEIKNNDLIIKKYLNRILDKWEDLYKYFYIDSVVQSFILKHQKTIFDPNSFHHSQYVNAISVSLQKKENILFLINNINFDGYQYYELNFILPYFKKHLKDSDFLNTLIKKAPCLIKFLPSLHNQSIIENLDASDILDILRSNKKTQQKIFNFCDKSKKQKILMKEGIFYTLLSHEEQVDDFFLKTLKTSAIIDLLSEINSTSQILLNYLNDEVNLNKVMNEDSNIYKYLPASFQNKKDIASKFIEKKNSYGFQIVPKHFFKDLNFCLLALEGNNQCLQFIHQSIWENIDFISAFSKKIDLNPTILNSAPSNIKDFFTLAGVSDNYHHFIEKVILKRKLSDNLAIQSDNSNSKNKI